MKKTGFGAGRYNGFGGKSEPGETIRQNAIREVREECGVQVKEADLELMARMEYRFTNAPPGKDWDQMMYVFLTRQWSGVIRETLEMRPEEFEIPDIPYKDMWPNDSLWLPKILQEQKIEAKFVFGPDNKHHIDEQSSIRVVKKL